MNILLLGYGKMGKTIEQIAKERGHHIFAAIDLEQREEKLAELDKSQVDVAIEFSSPEAAPANIRYCIREGIPVISGTTGWLKEKPAIEDYCIEHNGTFFYASNFSIGVNIFFRLNELLAEMMNRHQDYVPSLEEIHHTEKKDAPSGTAITLAEGMLRHLSKLNDWHLQGRGVGEKTGSVPIVSKREGKVPGTHTVSYRSEIDEIEIRHTAHSRQGFALGAVLVAEWIKKKKGILQMEDFLKF
ncbi:MAG: 4-hydroxy-tetrahydrodipicolinate reductase [Cyclobacteriaceae bacterium]